MRKYFHDKLLGWSEDTSLHPFIDVLFFILLNVFYHYRQAED
jgi:hypothetical protein